MRKISWVSLGSALFLMVSSTVCYFLRYLPLNNAKYMLFIGLGILVLAALLSILSAEDFHAERFQMPIKMRTPWNIFCFALSAVSLGFCIRAWYLFRGFDNPLWVMLLVSLACVVYLWVYYLLLYIPFLERHVTAYTILYVVLSLIGYILVIGLTKTTFVSTFGYYMLVEIAFLFALCTDTDSARYLIRVLTLSSFSVWIVGIIIAVLMLGGDSCDCDCDGCDCGGGSGGLDSPRKRKKLK